MEGRDCHLEKFPVLQKGFGRSLLLHLGSCQHYPRTHTHTHTLARAKTHTHTYPPLSAAAALQSAWFSVKVSEDSESKEGNHDNERKTCMQDVQVQQKSESLFRKKEEMRESWGMQLVV